MKGAKLERKTYIKIINTNHIFEIYMYDRLNVCKPSLSDKKSLPGSSPSYDNNYARNCQTRRDTIRRLVSKNFDKGTSKFITLTFRDTELFNIKDVKQCNAEFKKFIKRLKYKYPNIRYVAVIEFQDKKGRGAVHYHMIMDVGFIPVKELEKIWGLGWIGINKIDKVDNLGAYVIKYMTVENADDRLKGLKAYNCSTGLERPIEMVSWDIGRKEIDEIIKFYGLDKKKAVYFGKYDSEYAGECLYYQFNLNR